MLRGEIQRVYVNRIYIAGTELNAALEIIQPDWGPFDVQKKLYRVELQTKTQAITNLHFEDRYRAQDPFSTVDLIDVKIPYDFKLKQIKSQCFLPTGKGHGCLKKEK